MATVELRFYEELNDFLPRRLRKHTYPRQISAGTSVADVITAEGVPTAAVELVLADGHSVGLDYRPSDGQRLAIYPVFETLDLKEQRTIRPHPLRSPRFIADAHLGKLAEYLRMLGFDTRYRNDFADDELARLSAIEGRILLSRDRGLLQRTTVNRGYFVHNTRPDAQLREVLERFDLYGLLRPISRCIKCNGLLRPVGKSAIAGRLPADTRHRYEHFWQCEGCGRVYWKGSHYARMRRKVAALRRDWALDRREETANHAPPSSSR